jgi:hypothetical protein
MCLSARNEMWMIAYTLHRWWWHWWRDMRFVMWRKDKLSSYVCFVLTDQNTISEFLTNTVSITLHQNKHFTQNNTLLHDIHLYNSSSLQNIHLYNSSSHTFISTISNSINKQHLSLQSFYLYKVSISTLSSSQQNYLDKTISTKLSWQIYLNKDMSHFSFLMHNSNSLW